MMMKRLLILLSLFFFAQLALALPTLAEVEAEVRASRYSQAEAMMAEVVQAKPTSAKARYIHAEILAHNRQYEAAAAQMREARRLDPATTYADAGRVKAFEDQLQRAVARAHQPGSLAGTGAVIGAAPQAQLQTQAPSTQPRVAPAIAQRAAPAPTESDNGWLGWLVPAGFVVVGVLIVRALFRRHRAMQARQQSPMAAGWSPGYQAGGMGGMGAGGYPTGAPYGGAAAGGSALRTGMAVAGGLAAGMVLDRMLHSNEARAAEPSGHQALGQSGADSAGLAGADLDFERRNIDFGNGEGWGGPPDGGADGGGDGGGDGW